MTTRISGFWGKITKYNGCEREMHTDDHFQVKKAFRCWFDQINLEWMVSRKWFTLKNDAENESTIENVETKRIHFRSYCDLELVIGWKLMQRFFETSKIFTFNNIICIKSHLTSSSWSEKKSNLGIFQKQHGSKKVNYHFYFPMFKIWCLCFRTPF